MCWCITNNTPANCSSRLMCHMQWQPGQGPPSVASIHECVASPRTHASGCKYMPYMPNPCKAGAGNLGTCMRFQGLRQRYPFVWEEGGGSRKGRQNQPPPHLSLSPKISLSPQLQALLIASAGRLSSTASAWASRIPTHTRRHPGHQPGQDLGTVSSCEANTRAQWVQHTNRHRHLGTAWSFTTARTTACCWERCCCWWQPDTSRGLMHDTAAVPAHTASRRAA